MSFMTKYLMIKLRGKLKKPIGEINNIPNFIAYALQVIIINHLCLALTESCESEYVVCFKNVCVGFYKIINSEISSVEFFQNHVLLQLKEHEIDNCEKCGVATKIVKCVNEKRD